MLSALLLVAAALAASPHWKPSDAALKDYNRGVEALDAERLGQAERKLKEALLRDPTCGACQHALGVTLLRQDRSREAVDLLGELASTHPHRAEIMVSLSDAAFGAQDFGLALETAAIALVLDAMSWDALTAMVRACLRAGDLETAGQWIETVSGAHPDDRLACLQADLLVEEGAITQATAKLDKCERARDPALYAHVATRVAAASGDHQAVAQQAEARGSLKLSDLSRAFAAYEAGAHSRAASLLGRVLDGNPANAEAALLLGLAENASGHPERAMEALTRAFEGETWIEVDASGGFSGIVTASGAAVFEERLRQGVGLLIQLQVQQGMSKQARETLDRAKERPGPCAEITAGKVLLEAATGRPEVAAATAARGLERWPGVPMLQDAVRELLAEWSASRQPDLLEAAWADGILEAAYWQALAHRDMGQPDTCLERLDAALPRAEGASTSPMQVLAHACAVEAGDATRANQLLDAQGGPPAADPDVALNHARLLLDRGRLEDCAAVLDGLALTREDRRDYARTLQLGLHLANDHLDAAMAMLPTGSVTPHARLELALALLRAERIAEAHPLLEGACSELQDPGVLERCDQVRAELERLESEG